MKNICVFCSASNAVDKIYFKAADELGKLIGVNGYNLVYGGSNVGLMGAVANAAKQNGSIITGVIPNKIFEFVNKESGPCDDFILVDNMRQRKDVMDSKSDACIILPGGFGSLDELAEIFELKILGYHTKPVVFLNVNNFYDSLFEFFQHVVDEKFARQETFDLIYCATSPKDAIEYIKNYQPSTKKRTSDDIYVK